MTKSISINGKVDKGDIVKFLKSKFPKKKLRLIKLMVKEANEIKIKLK